MVLLLFLVLDWLWSRGGGDSEPDDRNEEDRFLFSLCRKLYLVPFGVVASIFKQVKYLN